MSREQDGAVNRTVDFGVGKRNALRRSELEAVFSAADASG
jgi:hypothetical protein